MHNPNVAEMNISLAKAMETIKRSLEPFGVAARRFASGMEQMVKALSIQEWAKTHRIKRPMTPKRLPRRIRKAMKMKQRHG